MGAHVFCTLAVTHVFFATGCDWRAYAAYWLIALMAGYRNSKASDDHYDRLMNSLSALNQKDLHQ